MPAINNRRAKALGLKIKDAKRPLRLEVQRKDISKGALKAPDACAFSRACKRTYKGVKHAYFFRSTAYLEYPTEMVRYLLPQSMQKEIVAFDRNRTMEPGEYRLSRPGPASTLPAIRKQMKRYYAKHGSRAKTNTGAKQLRHKMDNVRVAQIVI